MFNDIVAENKYYEIKKQTIKKVTIIFLIGFIIGIILIITGLVKMRSINNKNTIAYQNAYDESDAKASFAKIRIDEIKKEMDNLNNQISNKTTECSSIVSEENSKCLEELNDIKKNLINLESEKSNLEKADYTVYYKLIPSSKYKIFFYVGIGFIVATALVSVLIYDVLKEYELNKLGGKNYILPVQEKINNIANEFVQEIKEEVKKEEKNENDDEQL